jgi:hypothetical protein
VSTFFSGKKLQSRAVKNNKNKTREKAITVQKVFTKYLQLGEKVKMNV